MLSKDFIERVQDCTLTMFNQGSPQHRMEANTAEGTSDPSHLHQDAWLLQWPLSGMWEEINGTWANGRSADTSGASLPAQHKLIRIEHDVGKGEVKARPPSSASPIGVGRWVLQQNSSFCASLLMCFHLQTYSAWDS
jgi:hypothetical protein